MFSPSVTIASFVPIVVNGVLPCVFALVALSGLMLLVFPSTDSLIM
jgi:hypothetical protein